jgi:hypothetical protein
VARTSAAAGAGAGGGGGEEEEAGGGGLCFLAPPWLRCADGPAREEETVLRGRSATRRSTIVAFLVVAIARDQARTR